MYGERFGEDDVVIGRSMRMMTPGEICMSSMDS
jgi:hypothetical protein